MPRKNKKYPGMDIVFLLIREYNLLRFMTILKE